MRRAVLGVFAAVLCCAAFGQEGARTTSFPERTLPFVDDSVNDPELKSFLDSMRDAVRKRDVTSLLEYTADDVVCGFGGDDGKAAFVRMWKLQEKPEESPLWRELGEVLRLGGTDFTEQEGVRAFIAPYIVETWPDEVDTFEFGAIVGDKIHVRSGPGKDHPVLATVSRIIVRIEDEPGHPEPRQETINGETFPWQRIALPDGQMGYVWGKYVRSPAGYRATFVRENGKWRMSVFVAGD